MIGKHRMDQQKHADKFQYITWQIIDAGQKQKAGERQDSGSQTKTFISEYLTSAAIKISQKDARKEIV